MRQVLAHTGSAGRIALITGAVYVLVDVLRGNAPGESPAVGDMIGVVVAATVLVLSWPTFREAWRHREDRI